jgi:hypothetical protein
VPRPLPGLVCSLLALALCACPGGGDRFDSDGDGWEDLLDCGPEDPDVYPREGEDQVGDGLDDNCDGIDGIDADRDLHASVASGGHDCRDDRPDINPDMEELPDDEVDNDCDGVLLRCDEDEDGEGIDHPLCDGQDCDDSDPDVWSGAPERCNGVDDDCDGVVPADEVDADGDGAWLCEDCDDGDPGVSPSTVEIPYDGVDQDCSGGDLEDLDGDGHLPPEAGGEDCDDGDPFRFPGAADDPADGVDSNCDGWPGVDVDGDHYADFYDDCDDDDDTVHPGATELCDGVDQDCDGIPSALNMGDELDADGDGYLACDECDDGAPLVFPGATTICDGKDTDCDGSLEPGDEDLDADGDLACDDCEDGDPSLTTLDVDGDSWTTCAGDCDDVQASWNPSVTDIAGDGYDQNCDGADGLDADQDGWASIPSGGLDCDDGDPVLDLDDEDGDGQTSCDGDCDDVDPLNFVGNVDVCDGQDNDCNGVVDEAGNDVDGDGFGCGDCDDADPAVSPGSPEVCDRLDTDCDGVVPVDELDADGDGLAGCEGDCDDNDAANYPGNLEACDVQDNDCDGAIDEDTGTDEDGDGWYECQGDCDDTDVENFPFSPELCDGQDNDCDGAIPAADTDGDGDGYSPCAGDCDDGEAWINPGAAELVDGLDNDCDGVADVGPVVCTTTVPLDEPTIQGAVDAAGDGDVICVEPGTYVETVEIDWLTVELRGLAGPGMTIIQGTASEAALDSYQVGPGALLTGFTATTPGGVAGRLEYFEGAVQDLWLVGGGLGALHTTATVHRTRITGGWLGISSGSSVDATALVVLDSSGDAVFAGGNDSFSCTGCLIDNAASRGINLSGTCEAELVRTTIVGSGEEGVRATGDPSLSMSQCLVAGNQAGGLHIAGGVVERSVILLNAGITAGGIRAQASAVATDFTLSNSVVAWNTRTSTATGADGLWIDDYATPQITWSVQRNVFWDDDSLETPGGASLVGVGGNLELDPQFLGDLSHPNPLRWDLHLDSSSSLIGLGSGVDPDGSSADIGLYGGPDADGFDLDGDGYPEWWQPGPYDSVTYPALGWDCDDSDASVLPGQGC